MKIFEEIKKPFRIGSTAIFSVKDTDRSDWHGYKFSDIRKLEGKPCKIRKIEQQGNTRMEEFYTVEFEDGTKLEGVSGYQLD